MPGLMEESTLQQQLRDVGDRSMSRSFETLSAVALFQGLAPEAIRQLDTQCSWRRVGAKKWIVDYQDEGTDVFFVAVGHVRVLIRSPAGQEVILRDIRDGEFFGELAAIDGRSRSAGILAVTDATVARMPATVFRAAIHRFPRVCDGVMAILATQVRVLANRVNEYATLNARHRIYAELMRLSRPDPGGLERAVITPPPIHAEIAARVSARREAVARELKALERAGLLERRRGALVITDTRRLMQMIEGAVDDPASSGPSAAPAMFVRSESL